MLCNYVMILRHTSNCGCLSHVSYQIIDIIMWWYLHDDYIWRFVIQFTRSAQFIIHNMQRKIDQEGSTIWTRQQKSGPFATDGPDEDQNKFRITVDERVFRSYETLKCQFEMQFRVTTLRPWKQLLTSKPYKTLKKDCPRIQNGRKPNRIGWILAVNFGVF